MSSFQLLDKADLPDWFEYPPAFIRIVKLGLLELEPWWILDREQALNRMQGLKSRYPHRDLIPFARRGDNDDIACFERDRGAGVVVVHDFTKSGWEEKAVYASFWDWFKYAIDEMIWFEPWLS